MMESLVTYCESLCI